MRLQASKRQAEQNPAKKYINDFREGEMCRGVVKAFTNTGLVLSLIHICSSKLCSYPEQGNQLISYKRR